jgi:preprotein translocase subunit SecG
MRDILIAVLIVDSLSLIGLILLQRGKGAEAGAAFGGGGGGASDTLFGSRGSATFLSRLTAALAIVFFLTTMALAYYSAKREAPKSAAESVVEQTAPKKEAPAVPDSAPEQDQVPEVPK